MNARNPHWVWLLILSVGLLSSAGQENTVVPTLPVELIVAIEAKHGKQTPTIYQQDVRVVHDHNRLRVVNWVPYQGENAGLELFLLIDDSSTTDVGLQLDDLRKFINAQPPTTAMGVGYIRNGEVEVLQNFTKDHSLAAKALRLPIGAGTVASPYTAITDFVHRWPESNNRREIFMVSSGIDALSPGPNDPYLADAIESAQRAGVQVYSIYANHAGHLGHTFWQVNWGQSNLSQLADETGAEAYFQGFQMPISFAPYLNEFADRLQHQYRLTFLALPGKKSEFQKIRLETEVPNAELVAAPQVWVPVPK